MWNGEDWELLDFNVVSQFNIENIGEKIFSYNDDNIFNDIQAKLRCEYELINQSNFAEEISFSCVPIYLLDVNNKIRIKDKDTGIMGDYLVKNISQSLNFDGTMNIKATKIYY